MGKNSNEGDSKLWDENQRDKWIMTELKCGEIRGQHLLINHIKYYIFSESLMIMEVNEGDSKEHDVLKNNKMSRTSP